MVEAYKKLESRSDQLLGAKTKPEERLAHMIRARDEQPRRFIVGLLGLRATTKTKKDK